MTDESRFSLSSDSHRILIWRERGSRNHPSNINERDRYGGRGVLVWGGIMLGSRTDLHIFDAGSVNGTRYCNEILLPYVRIFRGAMGLQFLFMDDNAPCHRTVAVEQLLESEDIEHMDWPARSPDLNPIEHVWDFLGRRLAARTLPPVTIRELRLALQDEWAAMPQQLIDTLILSMGRRCETCLAYLLSFKNPFYKTSANGIWYIPANLGKVTDLNPSLIGNTSLQVQWTRPPDVKWDIRRYLVEWKSAETENAQQYSQVLEDKTQVTLEDLEIGTEYEVTVIPLGKKGMKGDSEKLLVSTLGLYISFIYDFEK
ncbi:transposable element Tcb2 transposase [Trichonephila clavipes]|nr:transposable element Tcb2 transposase [Trichonephila clavipes]